jgi:uncharacterized DUF497 family protein
MRFEWDEAKRQSNIRRHGFDFLDAEKIFAGETFSSLDDRFDYGEIRFLTIGIVNGRIVGVTHTQTDEVTRIISIRKALKNEQETYFKEIRN